MSKLNTKTTGILVASDFRKAKYRALYWVMFGFLLFLSIICIFPSIWIMLSAFKDTDEFLAVPPHLLPKTINLKKVTDAWNMLHFGEHFLSSVSVVLGSLLFCLFCNGVAGYVLSRIKPKGSGIIFKMIFWSMLMPTSGSMVILFAGFVDVPIFHFSLMNTHVPLWLMAGANAFYVLLFKSYFDSIDKAYIEAARIDGCTDFGIFFRIILPLSVPIMLTISIYTINSSWGQFLWPSLVIKDDKLKPIAQVVSGLGGGSVSMDKYMMAMLLTIIPPTIIFCFCSKRIMGGFNLGGIKG